MVDNIREAWSKFGRDLTLGLILTAITITGTMVYDMREQVIRTDERVNALIEAGRLHLIEGHTSTRERVSRLEGLAGKREQKGQE